MDAAASPDDGHRDHPAAANMSSSPVPTVASSRILPTAASSGTVPAAAAGASMSWNALVSALQPRDRSDISMLIEATDRPLIEIVSDFLQLFPQERRLNVIALLCTMLEETSLGPVARLNAFAIVHQSFAAEPEHPYATLLLKAACDGTSDKAERAFIQLLLTDSEDDSEILKESASGYSSGSLLQSMELLPWEKLEMTKDQAWSRLKHLCCILGLDYNNKVKEFGASAARKRRVLQMVDLLEETSIINFKELKTVAEELFLEWKLSNTPFRKIANFYWMIVIRDSNSSDEISGYDFLSNAAVDRAKKEATSLRTARVSKMKHKYLAQEKRLIKLLAETHLCGSEVGFHPTEEVVDYKREKKRLKQIIREVKSLSKDRKETVIRVEVARRAVSAKYPREEVAEMCRKAREAASELEGDETPYDDHHMGDVLKTFLDKYLLPEQSEADASEYQQREEEEVCVTTASRTRSGNTFRISQ